MSAKVVKKRSRGSAESILREINRRKLMRFTELARIGASGIQLRRMVEAGELHSLGSGIYASPRLDVFVATLLATTKYYPQAVISGHTAMQIHGLGLEYIERIEVDIPRETSIRNKMLTAHRVPIKRLTGIILLPFHGKKIRIYNLERTLCEAYLRDPAGPLFFKALKRYMARPKPNPDRIREYDRALKTRVLMHLQQEMADA